MVKVYSDNGKFAVEGSFDFGYAGVYKDEQIRINEKYENARNWECVKNALDTANCTDDDIAAFLTYHINELEKKVRANIKKLNDDFLLTVFSDMDEPAIEFWEHDRLTVRKFMPTGSEEELYLQIYKPASDAVQAYYKRCRDAKAEGRTESTNVEALLRNNLPMFSWDNFLKSVVPEHLDFNDEYFSFQCSDELGGVILCHAWCEFDTDLNVLDWHNF